MGSRPVGEVVALLQILEKPLARWLPSQQFTGDAARRGDVEGEEGAEPTEMIERLFRWNRGDGNAEVAADSGGDVADRDSLVIDRMQSRARGCGLQRQPKQASRVVPVHGGPAVGAVTGVRGDALLAGDVDQPWNEAVVAVTVHRRRQPQD